MAAAAAFLSLPILTVVVVMAGGWLLVVALELAVSGHASREPEPSLEPEPLPEPVSPGEVSPTLPADPLEGLPDGAPPPLAEPVPPAAEPVEELQEETEPNEPRAWNLWHLERAARKSSGEDAERDDERVLLLLYLREFAEPDGSLPPSFDALLSESFGELVGARAR